jgi:hypothetical protein
MRIVAWPPVGIMSRAPVVERPVARSQGLFTGARAVSSAGPARRVTSLSVSALSRSADVSRIKTSLIADARAAGTPITSALVRALEAQAREIARESRAGAGFMAQLWREIDGGVDLIRMSVCGDNWWLDNARSRSRGGGYTAPLTWTTATDPDLSWTSGGDPLRWFTGPVRIATTGTSADGYPTITLTGLPPNTIVVRPDDVIRSYPAGADSETARAVTLAVSDADGEVTIKLTSALPAGVISLQDMESVVFEVLGAPRGTQPVADNWTLTVDLREVLPDEYAGATEVDPW